MTPKQRFLTDNKDAAKFHFDYVKSRNFQAAADAALLQMQQAMSSSNDPNVAMRDLNQMAGAVRFLSVFSTIADPIEPPKPVQQTLPPNLERQ